MLTNAPQKDKEEIFNLVYNASLYTFEFCRVLRKSIYSIIAIDYLNNLIACLESNVILLGAKYLEWRVKIYLEIAHIYEENGSTLNAAQLLTKGLQKIQDQKKLEEQDPPLPEYSKNIYITCERYIKALMLKYELQSGRIKLDDWKKK